MTEYIRVVHADNDVLRKHRAKIAAEFARSRGELPTERDTGGDE